MNRSAGVLMPIFSLPSPYGIGTMGQAARDFLDFLKAGGQSYWQLLPIGPTSYGDSPYQSFSSFAGNPYFIDLDDLAADGLLEPSEYRTLDWGKDERSVDYALLYETRFPVLRLAVKRLLAAPPADYEAFWADNRDWLDNYALFMALKGENSGVSWQEWPDGVRLRREPDLIAARIKLADELDFWRGVQYLFFRQWDGLKALARERGISVIGDLPIYVALDSADVWANPKQFQLDKDLAPTEVAGCPPDAFTADGQLWGNPLFDWEGMKADGYRWWLRRIGFQFRLFDVLRIDHFRGFDEYYAIPYGDKTARNGRWRPGPGLDFFKTVEKELGKREIIAEDLGFLTDSVRELLKNTGYPGMKVLEFAFDTKTRDSEYLPHRYERNCVVYAGTHDNETIEGWLEGSKPNLRKYVKRYFHITRKEGWAWGVMRGAWSSVADLAVVQMQDLLDLGAEGRINVPSTLGGNWQWRMLPGQADKKLARRLRKSTRLYNRGPAPKQKQEGEHLMDVKTRLQEIAQTRCGLELSQCSDSQLYGVLLQYTQELSKSRPAPKGERKLYYFSAEFLMGKLLSNNLLALGVFDEVGKVLKEAGHSLSAVEDAEPEPSLGNGGLGRLAACFLDSIAALSLPGDGVGLNYHYGLFRQKFKDNKQTAQPDPWIEDESWLIPTDTEFEVPFGFGSVKAKLFDVAIPGAHTEIANRLHLFDVENPAPAPESGIDFDKTDLPARLTSFLYPDDSDEPGRLLRVYQQYFMVSAGAQLVLKELEARGYALDTLSDHVAIQINDTHPSMVIPELVRLLTQRGLTMDAAVEQVARTCAYTNHTILAEALEKWPLTFIDKVAPQLVPILRELDKRARAAHEDPAVGIIQTRTYEREIEAAVLTDAAPAEVKAAAADKAEAAEAKAETAETEVKDETAEKDSAAESKAEAKPVKKTETVTEEIVHMAHLDIHYGYSVNGVAALHTDILKSSELKPFYDIYPARFNNKTNGVTLRRWLEVCNPQLAALLDECVGREWRTDPTRLNKLMDFYNDTAVLDRMQAIKADNKRKLTEELRREQNIDMDPNSVFDIQVKRLHEYKRQQMNALYVIRKYLDIKAGKLPERPVTVIFGAKAAPAYIMAKHIIHLILCLRQLIENDPQVRPWLRVVMVENYNVSGAEKLIPACDISEQISLASKEASGTGNMKFMANGAVTLGTLDGANVEIADLVGPDNIYTFGAGSNYVIELYDQKARDPEKGYQSKVYYQRPAVKPLVDFLLDPALTKYGDKDDLKALWTDLTTKDWFMALLDTEAYIAARDRAIHDYGDKPFWARKMLVNTARCGFFSSDRTIAEYNKDIWHLS